MNPKKELFKGSVIVSVITFTGHILSTILKLLISRIFGIEGFGFYALLMTISRFFTTLIEMGYPQSIVHFTTKFRIKNDWENIKYFFIKGLTRIIIFSLLLGSLLFIFKDYLLGLIFSSNNINILFFILGIMVVFAINNYISGMLRGLKYFKEQAIIFTSLYAIQMISAILIIRFLLIGKLEIDHFLSLGIFLNIIALSIIILIINIKILKNKKGEKRKDIKLLNAYSYPIWLSSLLQSAFQKTDRIMLGLLSSIQQVGIYSAGLTFSILVAFPLKAMGPVFQPLITELYTKNDFTGISTLYNTMVRWALLFVVPTFGGIICFGEYFIQLFGEEFIVGYRIMIILSFSQLISTISGTSGTLLNMTGKQKSNAKIITVGLIITIILNILLIPKWGALGAAIGTSISVIFINAFRLKVAINYFGIKIDYLAVVPFIIKCTLLIVICVNMIEINRVHWIIMALAYTFVSGIIVYHSLYENEKTFMKRKIAETLNSNE